MWSNQGSESDATWEREDYLKDVYPTFIQNGTLFKSQGEICIRGRVVTPQCYGCTKTLASHEHVHHHLIHKHHSFMHKHFYMKHCYETCETCYCSFKLHCMYAL